MSADNKTVVRRIYDEIFSQGNLALADEVFDESAVTHSPDRGAVPGVEAVKRGMLMLREGFPDLQFTIDDLIADEDRVAVRFTAVGTHGGTFAGAPPTQQRITLQGMDIFRLRDGKVAERWTAHDLLGLRRQLGLS